MTIIAEQKPAVLILFVLTYVGLGAGRIPGLKLNRAGIALLGAIAVMLVSGNSTASTFSMVNWPTMSLLFGFFVISAQLRMSGFFDKVAVEISGRLGHPMKFLLLLIASTAGLSAFLNNDVVCYVLTPVVGAALVAKNLNPVPFLVALAAASNIGAGATLIGNAQNMMIGQLAGLSFLGYMAWSVVPVLFALGVTFLVARMQARSGPPTLDAGDADRPAPAYAFDLYHTTKGLIVLAAVVALFFTSLPKEVVVLVAVGIHFLSTKFKSQDLLALVDWQILVTFLALFVVSGTFQATGYGSTLVNWLEARGMDPARPLNEVLMTAGLTALIGNAPTIMLLVKLVPMAKVPIAYLLAGANSFSATSIMTASLANLIVVQQARRQGIVISFMDFARLGIPITAVSLAGLVGWAMLTGS
jgi:Na+/H+ antiporter NhaD/arsenite permease-like protein